LKIKVLWCKIHCVNFFKHTKLIDFWIEFGIKLNLTWKLVIAQELNMYYNMEE